MTWNDKLKTQIPQYYDRTLSSAYRNVLSEAHHCKKLNFMRKKEFARNYQMFIK